METVDLTDIIVMDGSASSILVGEDIATGDVICKPNVPGAAMAYKAAANNPERGNVIGISVTTTNAGGQCFYIRRGAIIESANITNLGNDVSYWLSDTPGKMGAYSDAADGGHVVMIAEAWVYGDRVKLAILDYKKVKETPLPKAQDVPNAPTLSGTPAIDSIDLTFPATIPTEASKIYGYILKRGNSTIYEGPDAAYKDEGLTPGTEYTYRVAAISNSGTSEYTEGAFRTLPKPTNIGNITIEGLDSVAEGDVGTYTALNDGDAGNRSYSWSLEGGTGDSTTASCEVTWGTSGAGKVTCTITSLDEDPQDSPASGSLDVSIT